MYSLRILILFYAEFRIIVLSTFFFLTTPYLSLEEKKCWITTFQNRNKEKEDKQLCFLQFKKEIIFQHSFKIILYLLNRTFVCVRVCTCGNQKHTNIDTRNNNKLLTSPLGTGEKGKNWSKEQPTEGDTTYYLQWDAKISREPICYIQIAANKLKLMSWTVIGWGTKFMSSYSNYHFSSRLIFNHSQFYIKSLLDKEKNQEISTFVVYLEGWNNGLSCVSTLHRPPKWQHVGKSILEWNLL